MQADRPGAGGDRVLGHDVRGSALLFLPCRVDRRDLGEAGQEGVRGLVPEPADDVAAAAGGGTERVPYVAVDVVDAAFREHDVGLGDRHVGTGPGQEVGVLPLGVEERAHRRETGADRPPLGAAGRPGDIDIHRPFDAAVATRSETRQVDPRHEQPTGRVPCGIARGRVKSRRVGCVQTPVAAPGDGVAPVGGDARRAGAGCSRPGRSRPG